MRMRETEAERDRQTDRQTETKRETDRQTDRQRVHAELQVPVGTRHDEPVLRRW